MPLLFRLRAAGLVGVGVVCYCSQKNESARIFVSVRIEWREINKRHCAGTCASVRACHRPSGNKVVLSRQRGVATRSRAAYFVASRWWFVLTAAAAHRHKIDDIERQHCCLVLCCLSGDASAMLHPHPHTDALRHSNASSYSSIFPPLHLAPLPALLDFIIFTIQTKTLDAECLRRKLQLATPDCC